MAGGELCRSGIIARTGSNVDERDCRRVHCGTEALRQEDEPFGLLWRRRDLRMPAAHRHSQVYDKQAARSSKRPAPRTAHGNFDQHRMLRTSCQNLVLLDTPGHIEDGTNLHQSALTCLMLAAASSRLGELATAVRYCTHFTTQLCPHRVSLPFLKKLRLYVVSISCSTDFAGSSPIHCAASASAQVAQTDRATLCLPGHRC